MNSADFQELQIRRCRRADCGGQTMSSITQSSIQAPVVETHGSTAVPGAAGTCQQRALTSVADTLPSPAPDNGSGVSNQRVMLIPDTTAALARKYNVSLRTAKRMQQPDYFQSETSKDYWGQLIPGRTVGRDGKSYPHQRHYYNKPSQHPHSSSLILAALRHARFGIRRADRIACTDGITPRDLAALASLFDEVSDIIRRWHPVCSDDQNDSGQCGTLPSQQPEQGLCLPLQPTQRSNPYQGGWQPQNDNLTVDVKAPGVCETERSVVA